MDRATRWSAVEAALEHAAWYGHPATGLAALPDAALPQPPGPAGVDLHDATPDRPRPAAVESHDAAPARRQPAGGQPDRAVPQRPWPAGGEGDGAGWAGVGWPAGVEPEDPEAGVPERVRWLAGVCLGAVGRYRTAARWLAPGGEPAGSLAASCLASHLRQIGRHAEAEPLDRVALATATTAEAAADAMIGLVADAVGRHELALARDRLETATERIVAAATDYTKWRSLVRLEWVAAETALIAGESARAVEIGRSAQRISRTAKAYRHTVKSTLVLGVALDAAGRTHAAVRVLRIASRGATHLGLTPLLVPIHSVLGAAVQVRSPRVAARERRRADAAQRAREDPADNHSSG